MLLRVIFYGSSNHYLLLSINRSCLSQGNFFVVVVIGIGTGVGSWIPPGFACLVLDQINDIKLDFSGFKGECNLSLFLGEQVSRAKGHCYRIKNVVYVTMTFAMFLILSQNDFFSSEKCWEEFKRLEY